MEAMKEYVCSPEAGQAVKEAGLFGESVWVWRRYTCKDGITWQLARRDKWTNPFDVPAVMLEEALDVIGEMPRVKFCNSGITAGNKCFDYPTDSDEAVRLAVRIKEGQAAESELPKMNCPQCGKEYDDGDGFGVLYCPECGYCQHASVTDGKCDYCGKEIK